jgi:hypothetical protein
MREHDFKDLTYCLMKGPPSMVGERQPIGHGSYESDGPLASFVIPCVMLYFDTSIVLQNSESILHSCKMSHIFGR